jgi:oligosaccharyltransferase complex subunit beta
MGKVLYKGVSMRAAANNELVTSILVANPTSYVGSGDSTKMFSDAIGSNMVLVAGVQARNNARIGIAGSLKTFSNEYMLQEDFGNAAFALALSRWTFGRQGVLRFRDIQHSQEDGTPPDVILHEKERPDLPQSLYPDPEITRNSLVYRIKDRITYSLIVEEVMPDGSWVPFLPDDMQMEFVMMDPYVRTTMIPNAATKRVETTFDAPDDYGIFKFRVLYRRAGYSVLHAETKVSLRPFKHDEYERFIFAAYPYYLSSLVMGIAFFVFSVAFLALDEGGANKADKKPKAD